MANIPSEVAKSYIGIIVDNEDPNNLGGHKVFCPEIHGRNVKVEHLPWVRYQVPAGGGAGSVNYGVLDKGQLVTFTKNRGEGGTGFGTITGVLQTQQKSNPNMSGDISLITAYEQIQTALNAKMPVNVIPDIEEVIKDGARIRQVKEKNKEHSHSLLKEMMSHAANFPMNGTIIPQITNLSTSKASSSSRLTSSMMSSMPGIPLNIGQLLNLLPDVLKKELMKAIPPEVFYALENVSALTGSVSTMNVDGVMGNMPKVNPITFLPAAVEMLKGAKSPADAISMLGDIMSNPQLGAAQLESIVTKVGTPFGEMTQLIDPISGEITDLIPDIMAKAQEAFGGLVESLPSAGDKPLFGDSSNVINEMMGRLENAQYAMMKEMTEQNISTAKGTDPRKRLNEIGGITNTLAKGAKAFFGG